MILIKELKDDIFNTLEQFQDEKLSLDQATEYTTMLLIELYTKKKDNGKDDTYESDKYVFKHFVKQLIAELFPSKYGYYYNNFTINDNSHVVDEIKTLPQPEQRTPEWYAKRKLSIGASEGATVFNDNPYASKKKLILTKLGWPGAKFTGSIHTRHGVIFEPIVQHLYSLRHKTELWEFGSILHKDPELYMISASPDGITPKGIAVEIKVPLKRPITGIPPKYYWYQMQQQMQVLRKLDLVHFVECDIKIFVNSDDYKDDFKENINLPVRKNGLAKGVIIIVIDKRTNEEDYIYPEKFLNLDEIDEWRLKTKKECDKKDHIFYSETIYWKLEKYSETNIWRDEEWWEKNKGEYVKFWKGPTGEKIKCLEYYKKNGYQDILPRTGVRKIKHPKVVKCLIDSDSDSD